jgi:hypothetical protein
MPFQTGVDTPMSGTSDPSGLAPSPSLLEMGSTENGNLLCSVQSCDFTNLRDLIEWRLRSPAQTLPGGGEVG